MSDGVKKEDEMITANTGAQPTFDLFNLLKRIVAGRVSEPDEAILRRVIVEGLVQIETQNLNAEEGRIEATDLIHRSLDLQELTFATCGLALLMSGRRVETSMPQVRTAVVIHQGRPSLQVWTRDDASDVKTRPLTDLEETALFQHFVKKIQG